LCHFDIPKEKAPAGVRPAPTFSKSGRGSQCIRIDSPELVHLSAGIVLNKRRSMIAATAVVSAVMGIADAAVRSAPGDGARESFGSPASVLADSLAGKAATREASALTPHLRARGYNACYVPENGFGPYTAWRRIGMGQMILPVAGGHTEDGGYDVVIHFHGHDAVRHAFIEVARGAVLVGIDLGDSSGPYEHAFEQPQAFPRLLQRIIKGLVDASGDPRAHIRHFAIASWSAGYGAVKQILTHDGPSIEAVVLLDSLHSGYEPRRAREPGSIHAVAGAAISPVRAYAERAAAGHAILYLSHSQIVPPGYASTTEVADYLIDAVGGVRTPRQGITPLGAELVSGFDRRGMHVRGYIGGDKAAHCAHAELLAEAVRDYLEPAWNTPPAETSSH